MCIERGLQPGPIGTFQRWKDLGRHVRRGERAITLCMPVTVRRTNDNTADDASTEQDDTWFTRFVYRRNWFVLSQTDGEPLTQQALPEWDRARALNTLRIEEIPFEMLDGNCQGYARARQIAVSPVAALPHKTTFHECAHVLLHTGEPQHRDDERTPRSLKECEAEAVAMLCCAALGLPGVPESRGYIQNWWGAGNEIPERSCRRILACADQILKAGRVASEAL